MQNTCDRSHCFVPSRAQLPTCGDYTDHVGILGDRIVCVNGKVGLNYAQVVQLIQHSETYLHLLVVPKEDDLLQQVSSKLGF